MAEVVLVVFAKGRLPRQFRGKAPYVLLPGASGKNRYHRQAPVPKEDARYRALGTGAHDFIALPDGSLEFGAITPKIVSEATKPVMAAPIRLMVGSHVGRHRGFGVKHILAEHGEEIAKTQQSIPEFVQDALHQFQQLWLQPNGRLALVRTGKRGRVTVIELEQAGNLYSVITAYVRNPDIRIEGEMVWNWR